MLNINLIQTLVSLAAGCSKVTRKGVLAVLREQYRQKNGQHLRVVIRKSSR